MERLLLLKGLLIQQRGGGSKFGVLGWGNQFFRHFDEGGELFFFFTIDNPDFLSTTKQGDNGIGSIRLSVCPFVCLFSPDRLTFDFDLHVNLQVNVKGRGQGQRSISRSHVKVKGLGQIPAVQRSILGARLCRVQQGATTSVSVISGCMLIIPRMWSIGF